MLAHFWKIRRNAFHPSGGQIDLGRSQVASDEATIPLEGGVSRGSAAEERVTDDAAGRAEGSDEELVELVEEEVGEEVALLVEEVSPVVCESPEVVSLVGSPEVDPLPAPFQKAPRP